MRELKYYDFYVGIPGENPKEWRYKKIKLAAYDPLSALFYKRLLLLDIKKAKIENLSLDQSLYHSYMAVRRIVEFELAKVEGKTKYRFKKINEYTLNKHLKIIKHV